MTIQLRPDLLASDSLAPERPLPVPPEPIGDALQWGLAALAIGCVMILASCLTLVFNILFWKAGPAGIPMALACAGGALGVTALFGLAVAGLICGIRGWQRAYETRACPALPIAGTLCSVVGLGTWLVVSIDLILILHSFTS